VNSPRHPKVEFTPFARRSWTDLGPRVASALVLIAATVAGLYFGGFVFSAMVGAVFAGCYREWDQMVTLKPLTLVGGSLTALVAFSGLLYPAFGILSMLLIVLACVVSVLDDRTTAAWRCAGLIWFGLVTAAVLQIRGTSLWNVPGAMDWGLWGGFFLGLVIWATDTGAFFTGRQVGGEKLAPDISPSKTWSGAIGGLAIGTLAGLVLWLIVVPASPWWIGLLLAAALSIVGQVGDLVESAIKRRFRVKDSGDIIPGHGGLMDRLDSTTFGAVFLFAIGALHAGPNSVAQGFLGW
jgi:phosphatidate cytidylyltransferase